MKTIRGVITALVTPFHENGSVDFPSLENLVRIQLKAGVQGFVINGTTAESPTLEPSEVKDIWQMVQQISGAETTLILGTGSNSTRKTLQDSKLAADWGASAALVVVPYYNKPPQRGLFQHFKVVAEESGAPILLYNVPGRTACSLAPETTIELSYLPNIIGIKDASGDLEAAEKIQKQASPEFIKLSGDDGTYAEYLMAGGNGIISVASHVMPELFLKMTTLAQTQKFDQIQILQRANKDMIEAFYIEANPIPVKKALQILGIIKGSGLRLPLIQAQASTEERLKFEMKKRGLIS